MELLQTFEYGPIKVETYYNGTDKLPNKVYIDGVLVCEDDTFRPSPLFNIDDTETMVSLLGFITLQNGDVDAEYFEKQSCPALNTWANENPECEDIKLILGDWEMRNDEEWRSENSMTYEECVAIETYIFNH